MLHLRLKDEIAERPDWGRRRVDSTPFSLLLVPWESRVFGLSRALLFCCYHSIFDFQLKRLLSASYIIPCDEGKPQTEEMRTLLVGAHICIPLSAGGAFPPRPEPRAKAEIKKQMKSQHALKETY